MTPDERLEAIYDQIPGIDCQGFCRTTCTQIAMSKREHERIAEAGVEIAIHEIPVRFVEPDPCAALTIFGQCRVYGLRPTVCRLWGVTEGMECPYGCVPERYLTRDEGLELIAKADLAGGEAAGERALTITKARKMMKDPRFQAYRDESIRVGREGDREKARRR